MQKFLKPKDRELKVRMPESKKFVPENGAWFDLSGKHGSYYRRRIKENSLIVEDKNISNNPISNKANKKEGKYNGDSI